MGNWTEECEIGAQATEGNVADAEQHRRLVQSGRSGRLPLGAKGLLLILT